MSIQSQMYPTFDISVRFFGIDWPHVFRISQSLIQRVEQLSETLLGTKTEIPPTQGTLYVTDIALPSINVKCLMNFGYCYFFIYDFYLATSNVGSHAKSSPAQTSEHRSQKFRDTVNRNVIRSTNKSSSDDPSSTTNTHLRLPTSTSEPHMANRRAWPAATTVLAQAASTGKAKNRYIDILIPRYYHNYS